MLVNNVHVQGMFLYDPNAIYEKGDFLVVDDTIYVCQPQMDSSGTVSGIEPGTEEWNKNFKIYLGDRIASSQDYFDFIGNEKPELGAKYIDLKTLPDILNQYHVGFDGRGIIRNYLGQFSYTEYNPKTQDYEEFQYGSDPNGTDTEDNILDKILTDPNLNNATYFISKKFKGISSILLEPEFESRIKSEFNKSLPETNGVENKTRGDSFSNSDCILRQYTYVNATGWNQEAQSGQKEAYFHRLQELIDPYSGIIFYRVTDQIVINNKKDLSSVLDGLKTVSIGEWKSCFAGGSNRNIDGKYELKLVEQWTYVLNYYQQEINNYQELQSYLSNRFGFKEVDITTTSPEEKKSEITLHNDSTIKRGFVNDPIKKLVGVTVRGRYKFMNQDLFRSSEITIDIPESGSEIYIINDNLQLTVSSDAKIVLNSRDNGKDTVDNDSIEIRNIYYREHYRPISTADLNPYPPIETLRGGSKTV